MIIRLLAFLVINFGALGIGGFFTGKGVPSSWYTNLNKAPWTPPGWVFGTAWTTIMICFSVAMAILWPSEENRKLLIALFGIQWILNVLWNPVFFHFNNTVLGLVIICTLTLVVAAMIYLYSSQLGMTSALIWPYFVWLLIATSLNAYIVIKN